jgi:hypothetical protein
MRRNARMKQNLEALFASLETLFVREVDQLMRCHRLFVKSSSELLMSHYNFNWAMSFLSCIEYGMKYIYLCEKNI